MDSILLQGIKVVTRIGVMENERAVPQPLQVDIQLFHPASGIAKTDDVKSGIDYKKVTDAVLKLRKTERKTVERFAEDIAVQILKEFKPEGGVTVTVHKNPDLPLESASVTIHRP